MALPHKLALTAILVAVCGCQRTPSPSVETKTNTRPSEEPAVQRVVDEIDPPTRPGAMAPRLVSTDESLLMIWLEPSESGVVDLVRFSTHDGERWSEPTTVATSPDLFANWADIPAVARSKSGFYLAAWPQKTGKGTYDYGLKLARSSDGVTWTAAGWLHNDGTNAEHGFVSMVPWNGGIQAFWLDGREMVEKPPGPMTLRRAFVSDEIRDSAVVDDRVCDCCGTAATATATGPLVVFRDRTESEIRDPAVARLDGDSWTTSRRVHADDWTVTGCPVNGPQVVSRGEVVAAAWFTGTNQHHSVRVAFSDDGGDSFDLPINAATYAPGGGIPLGRVDLVRLDDNNVIVSWLDSRTSETVIAARRVSRDGRLSPTYDVARSDESRGSGFPQIELFDQTLVAVWTEANEPTRIRGRNIPLELVKPLNAEAPTDPPSAGPSRNWRVPILHAETLTGERVRLKTAGKPLLVSLWATWCEPCREELPVLSALQKARREDLDVVAINVDVASERAVVSEWAKLAPDLEIWLDATLHAQTIFGTTSLPANYLFDADGRLVWHSFSEIAPEDPEFVQALRR